MSEPENANARRQRGERSNELTDESRLEVGARDVNAMYGPPELCAWQVEKLGSSKGIFWLQTTVKAFGRKLSKRRDTRHVDVVGWNHFRRTYEMRGSWRKIKRLIDRYILSAAGSISPVNRPQGASQFARRVSPGRTERADFRRIPPKNPPTAISTNLIKPKRQMTLQRKAVHLPTETNVARK